MHNGAQELALSLDTTDVAERVRVSGAYVTQGVGAIDEFSFAAPRKSSPEREYVLRSVPSINQWLTGEWRNGEPNARLIAAAVRNHRNRFFLMRHEGTAAGLVALSNIEEFDKTAMIWYALGRQDLGGRGVSTEAVKQLARLVFTEMELASLYAWVMDVNVASRRVLQKAGFKEAGRLRDASSYEGRQVDRLYFDRIASDPMA